MVRANSQQQQVDSRLFYHTGPVIVLVSVGGVSVWTNRGLYSVGFRMSITLIVVIGVIWDLCNRREHSYLCGRVSEQSSFERAWYYYSGIKIYNHLPTAIKDLSADKNKFKLALKRYLLHYPFYSLEEYFNT